MFVAVKSNGWLATTPAFSPVPVRVWANTPVPSAVLLAVKGCTTTGSETRPGGPSAGLPGLWNPAFLEGW